ncbi:malate dehydrogenase [Rhodovulum sulfidophilum]|uniref:Malate dehydrogenase n=1 Tax=Rhodovulum sulfidophilum TaxID=35806 RepID=A0A0D6B2R0_RHOSU|nr:malate dehydrogenase [Rhodovulum sulfidophilum]
MALGRALNQRYRSLAAPTGLSREAQRMTGVSPNLPFVAAAADLGTQPVAAIHRPYLNSRETMSTDLISGGNK